jgi:hypothetical protein
VSIVERARIFEIPRDNWQRDFTTIIGTYAVIRQFQLYEEQLALARQTVRQAEDYLDLTKWNFWNIAVPTWNRQRDLFDRYVANFAYYEVEYMSDAFRFKEYEPDYTTQEGRTQGQVQYIFDRAALQRKRQIGKYAAGRACHDAVYFATMTALAKVDAANHGYRYEEAKKRELDAWYWQRRTDGARITDSMANRVVAGINNGANVATNAINAVGRAVSALVSATNAAGTATHNAAQAYGALANGAFRAQGYAMGRGGNGFDIGGMIGGMQGFGGNGYQLVGPRQAVGGAVAESLGRSSAMVPGGGDYETAGVYSGIGLQHYT